MYSGGSGLSEDIHFVGFRLSFHALSSLPIVLSKHLNHPHPYIEIATSISDTLTYMHFWQEYTPQVMQGHVEKIYDYTGIIVGNLNYNPMYLLLIQTEFLSQRKLYTSGQ